jgi:hypothetical protein
MDLGSSSFGSNFSSGVFTTTGSTDLGSNQYGYEIWQVDFSFNPIVVPPGSGSYWATLSNATSAEGQPVYWDENGEPSSVYANSVGSIPSESFTIDICHGCLCSIRGPDCAPPTPEPSSMMLFGSGILAVVGVLRRKLNC